MKAFKHYMPVNIQFGNGRINDASLFNLPFNKALILTDPQATNRIQKPLDQVLKNLEENSIKYIIDDTITHPLKKDDILHVVSTAKDFNCDFIIAIGGGRTLDAGKIVARFAKENQALIDAWIKSRIVPPFENDPLFLLSIPTSFNLASALNPKAFVYDLVNRRQVRLKHESLFPKLSIIDPDIASSLPLKERFNAVIEAFVRAIDLVIEEPSTLHVNRSLETLKYLIRYAPALNKEDVSSDVLYMIDYALYNLYELYLPKPWFPLSQISDSIEGYHETLPNSAFISEASLIYLKHRGTNLSKSHTQSLKEVFTHTPFDSPNVMVSVEYFLKSLKKGRNNLSSYGLELALVSDYMVHLKTVYPAFDALSNDALYDIIETTLIGE